MSTPTSDPARWALSPDQLDELELILGGLLGPAKIFHLRVEGPGAGQLLARIGAGQRVAGATVDRPRVPVLLTDLEGTPVARLDVSRAGVDGTTAEVSGPVSAERPFEHGVLRTRRLTRPLGPADVAATAFLAETPPSAEDAEHVRRAAAEGPVVLLGVTDAAQSSASSTHELIAALDSLAEVVGPLARTRVHLLPVPSRLRPAGGRLPEAVVAHLGAARSIMLDGTRAAAARRTGRGERDGAVIMLTGLSGSGKSTVARALRDHLLGIDDREVTLLDGDEMRRVLSSELGFSRSDREANVRRIGWVAALVAKHGGVALCAPIAPYAASRAEVRTMAEGVGQFILVHVSTPLAVCEARDRKGLYARARTGLLPEFTGISDPYEEPLDADVRVDTSTTSVDQCVQMILPHLHSATSAPHRHHLRST